MGTTIKIDGRSTEPQQLNMLTKRTVRRRSSRRLDEALAFASEMVSEVGIAQERRRHKASARAQRAY